MSEGPKEKKPYLKRNSRQFLSNAQVRSQANKLKIVDFGQSENDEQTSPVPKTVKPIRNKFAQEEEIQIKVKPRPVPKQQASHPKNKEQNPISIPNNQKAKRETSTSKKKEATLSDYLDNDFVDIPAKKKTVERNIARDSNKSTEKTRETGKKGSMVSATLFKQQQCDSDEEVLPSFGENNSSFKPIPNPFVKFTKEEKKSPIKNNRQEYKEKEKQKEEQINFISNSEESDHQEVYHKKQTRVTKKQNISSNEQSQHPSKIKMNYFNHNKNSNSKQIESQQPVVQPKVLTIADIPKQLKEQIIREAIAEKQQELQNQLNKLKQKVVSVTKTKEKLEEEQKAMAKARQDFDKQMEERYKQFQEKMKTENNKLTREKKYMKDAQMSNKGDWKAKVQVADLKKALEEAKEEKKKIQGKYKIENENLRKKVAEQTNKNKLLGEQVKLLEYGKMIQQEQIQEKARDHKKNQAQVISNQWTNAPKSTFLSRFYAKDFTLIEFKLQMYYYDSNQYYHYYLNSKDVDSVLESENEDSQRVKRVYRNGKVEHEYFNKFLKQIFPFKYSIVNFLNGDIKQTLPDGLIVYFSSNSQNAIQYTVRTESFSREIVYFPNDEIVQMQYTDLRDENKSFSEVFNGEQLKKTFRSGVSTFMKKDSLGNITQYTLNH